MEGLEVCGKELRGSRISTKKWLPQGMDVGWEEGLLEAG